MTSDVFQRQPTHKTLTRKFETLYVVHSTDLTHLSPGTICLDQSQLARLIDVNEDMITSMEALQQVPPQKPFVPKYPILVLDDYNKEVYPLHY